MSGPSRRNSSRGGHLASPYARPSDRPKKSSWSIRNLLSFLNPYSSKYQDEYYLPQHGRNPEAAAAAESLSSRGHQISQSINETNDQQTSPVAQPPPSASPATPSRSPTSATFGSSVNPESPQKGLDYLKQYLGERPADEPLSSTEAAELISIIQKSTPVEEHETFRFSTPTSNPTTPLRGNTPLFPSTNNINTVPFSFSPSYTANAPTTPSPAKPLLLKQNPNGTYRWEGGGSAKQKQERNGRSKNRYHSPAFGPPPRSSSGRLVLRESPEKAAEPVKTDTKRRRVGEEIPSSTPSGFSPLIRSPAPAPSPTRAAEARRIPISATPSRTSSSQIKPTEESKAPSASTSTTSLNGVKSSTSIAHLRASLKPTTPARPSPLRQAWGQPSSPTPSSKSSDDGHSPISSMTTATTKKPKMMVSQKATKTASFMSELIKEVTPVKNLDVSNPYQAASPVKIVGNAKPKTRPTRRTRASGRPSAPPEGLVSNGKVDDGKGKERNGVGMEQEKEKEKEKDLLEKYSAQDILSATLPKGSKRSRAPDNLGKGLPNGLSSARSSSPPKSRVEPKQRFSTVPQIEEVEDEEDQDERSRSNKKSKGSGSESQPKYTLPTSFPPPMVNGHSSNRKTASPVPAAPIIEEITDDDMNGGSKQALTTPSEVVEVGNGSSEGKNKTSGSGPLASSSPFSTSTTNKSSMFGASGSVQKNSAIPREPSKLRFSYKPESATPTPSETSPTTSNGVGEAAETVATTEATFGFDTSKSTKVTTATTPASFEFGTKAAGTPSFLGPAQVASPSTTDPVTSAPKPKSTANFKEHVQTLPVTSLPVFSFDDETPVASGSGLSSGSGNSVVKALAAAKDIPMSKLPLFDFDAVPVAVASSSAAPLASTSKTFNWAAAGIKPPSTSEWICSECKLSNKDSSADKCAICEAPRPGKAPKAAQPATFDWSGAGMKKPSSTNGTAGGGDAEWTCLTCMLKNPASAVSKCGVCEAPRPSAPSDNTNPSLAAPPKAPIQSFNWGAAGLKPPEPKPGAWQCDACGCTNPEKAAKCEVCDASK
ncbi:hypothetical protein F5878DRAFT_727242 [Lentinula raphanica]|uniref:RanBP2-type domain-containing protein n=1 Tax=Lentinula raphanica TaxID=153919 RepID=A0AA38P3V9_9AGAR|nr:hypothetical protein F5878DRAFT_727242 [Lentinula raphanica]